ncbi:MAG TPA: RNA polymerase sigma-54 factor, partial [Ideonella sp.]|nr:RNA polymerase sigma-54 factor [Ideonella sp.]
MRSVALRVEHRQQQALSPRLQQAVRLLQLSSLDFAQEVQDAMAKNPFLEGDESDAEPPTGVGEAVVPGVPGAADAASATATQTIDAPAAGTTAEAEAEADAYADGERDVWQADGMGSGRRGEDGDLSLMDMMAVETSLAGHLHSQLNVLSLSLRDLVLAKAIVESLDDDGYLRLELPELVAITDLSPPASLEELQIALRRVQALEPAGIAARNVRECLLLQLPTIDDEHERELAHAIVSEHLEALAAKDMSTLSRQLSLPVGEVETICARIRRLDPRPGWRFGAARVQYVTPDVIVKKVRGVWTVTLNPAIVPKVRLNHV